MSHQQHNDGSTATPIPDALSSYRFVEYELSQRTREVRRGGERLNLSKKSFDLLLCLLQAAPDAISHQDLIDRLWPREVVNEEALKQRVSVLRKALGAQSNTDALIENIRGFGYRLLAPVVVIDEIPAAASEPPTRHRTVWGWSIALAGAGLALAAVLWQTRAPPPAPAPELAKDVRIAVLPFANLTGLESEDFFASGLTEELINLLANTRGLRVIARTSVVRFRGSERSAREIGQALAVDALVEGSVARQDDALRVNVRLIDASTEEPLWNQQFAASTADVFAVQSEIAHAVSLALRPGLAKTAFAYRPTANLKAYEWFLRGLDAYRSYTPVSNENAIGFFRRAAELDPEFAEAHSGLANALGMKASYGYGEEYAREALHRADLALELKADLPDALKAKGQALQWLGREEEALKYTQRALEFNPHFSLAINNAGEQLVEMGRFDHALPYQLHLIADYWQELTFQAEAANRLALTLVHLDRAASAKVLVDAMTAGRAASGDPTYGRIMANLRLGDLAAADFEAQRASELYRGCSPCQRLAGFVAEIAGDEARAVIHHDLAWRLSNERDPNSGTRLARLLWNAGDPRAAELLDKVEALDGEMLESGHQDYGHYRRLAAVFMLRGQTSQALEYLDKAVSRGWVAFWLERLDPLFQPLKDDPAYQALLQTMERRLAAQAAAIDAASLDRDLEALLAILRGPATH